MNETLTLAEMRRRAGMTQPQVAERMHVTRNQVSKIEAKFPNIMFTTLRAYLDALGTDIKFIGPGMNVESSVVVEDPTRQQYAETIRRDRARRGAEEKQLAERERQRLASGEELVLKGNQAEPGGDHTGWEVDQPDAHSDQSDGGQRHQP